MLVALIVLALLVAALLVAISQRPAGFQVERSALIPVAPDVVFDEVNDFHNWEGWSPWAGLDPEMTLTYEGEPAGTGAVYLWKGNKKAGEGRMEILESRRPHLVRIRLQFFRPFPATNVTEFVFAPEAGGTRVTWTMSGENNFLLKAFGLLMRLDMDKLVGGDFERGLAQLRTAAEAKAAAPVAV